MSDEPIEWHDYGSVTFREFDDGDRHMRSPKWGHIRRFERQLREVAGEYADELRRLSAERDEAREAEDLDRLADISDELRDLNAWGLVDSMVPWYRNVFEQLSEPLPEDTDDWPGYFADLTLPGQLVNQWKMRPKASGAERPAP